MARDLVKRMGVLALLILMGCATTAKLTPTATVKPKSDTHLSATARTARVGGTELRMGLPPLTVWLHADIQGPPSETLYCPQIAWMYPDGTEDTEESECPAWEETEEFPRHWTKGLILGNPGDWQFYVEARKGNVVLARQEIRVKVHGDLGTLSAGEARAN